LKKLSGRQLTTKQGENYEKGKKRMVESANRQNFLDFDPSVIVCNLTMILMGKTLHPSVK